MFGTVQPVGVVVKHIGLWTRRREFESLTGYWNLSYNSEAIVKTLWELRTLSPRSQSTYSRKLKYLNNQVNLNNQLETEHYILSLQKSSKYKSGLLLAYLHYCKANSISWTPPKLRSQSMPINVPTEDRIDKIISRCSLKYITIFQISKHGLRPDEVSKIVLRDIDLQRGLLFVRSSKLGADRTIKLKEYALDNLKSYINRKQITQLDVHLFPNPELLREQWNLYRKRAYRNFKDTELLKIRLYDLRHWFATTEYIKTRDLLHVKYLLGHRDIKSTLIYVHIANAIAQTSDDYTCKTAKNLDEACLLIQSGFEYVTELDGIKLFRKRK